MAENRLKLSLKLFNSAMGLGGIAIIMYCVFMFKVWQLDGKGSSSHHNIIPSFLHTFLAVGIALCAITCLGHIAASMANFSWLYTYIVILLLLLLLETVILADAFVNPNWKEVIAFFLNLLTYLFISFNYISKWIAWLIFLIQAICVLLATLRIHETNVVYSYDSEEEDEEEDDDPEPVLSVFGRQNHWLQSDPNIV